MNILYFPARRIALVLVFALLHQAFFPTLAMALTSGPTQPEASSFTPAGTSDMVDLFSGDFQYNIPLLDVGGYPINISYNAGVGMDEEASWVGLGWNLNPGVVNRQMRGLPDDFRGDSIYKSYNILPDKTTGVNVGGALEIKGLLLNLSATLGMYKNSYTGYGIVAGISPVLSINKPSKPGLTAGLGLQFQSQNGLDLSPSLGLSQQIGKVNHSLKASRSINSRRGLRDLSISYNVNKNKNENKNENKNRKTEQYFSGGGSISFNESTYTPTADLPLSNKSFTFHGSVGLEHFALNPSFQVEGYQTEQKLVRQRQKQSAYGYLHSQLAKPSDLMDFNRERNGLPWREDMPVLPVGFGTNDLFAASGQGASGQFRAIRNDIGYFKDALHKNESESGTFGIELGFAPNLVKVGLDIHEVTVDANSKGWTENNALATTAGFTDWDGKTLYEPVFFKNSGEMTVTDTTFFAQLGKTAAAQADLEKSSGAIRTAFKFSSNQQPSGSIGFNSNPVLQRTAREKRNDVWQYLTGKEASTHGLEKQIYAYKRWAPPTKQIRLSKDVSNCAIDNVLSRTNRFKGHHLSEVTVLKPDGTRYVYGLPAYNTYQKEVSFSVNEATNDNGSGLIVYGIGDNTLANAQGRDHYYSSEVTPAYPYAFMLTGVLSPDYIDRTDNGITSDDYGTAVRINYSKNANLFKWRTPVGIDSANVTRVARYQPGRKSDPKSKKASYIYGNKEIWYVHSIESATMVAQFYTTSRYDGLGVLNEDGGINTDTLASLQKLDKIELYSKADLQKYGNAATPIKSVRFEYNYELCPGVPNSNNPSGKGKLTLKKIWFTYGKSGRGQLNAYTFQYNKGSNTNSNNRYFYNMTRVDRWGNYKVNPIGYPNTSEYPFAIQDTTMNTTSSVMATINDYAGAWSLNSITLPSGGKILVDYEADDYAYVQNKRAGQMYFIKGFSRSATPHVIDNMLYEDNGTNISKISRFVWVDLDSLKLPANTLPDTNAFKARCMEDISNIYFSMDVSMKDAYRENITGYMEYEKSIPLQITTVANGNLKAVGIPVKIIGIGNGNHINPITKAALQTMRLELPALSYPGYETDNGFQALIQGMVGLGQSLRETFGSFDIVKMKKGNAKTAGATINNLKTSWIRLCNPRFKKFGGGHRVKKITMSDNWNNMASGQSEAIYGQTYTYTTKQKVKVGATEQNLLISSGVASWEPTIGGEENLWKEPVTFLDRIKLAPNNTYYVEKPFGESLFPAAMVGYSEVKVQSIGYMKNNRTGSGWTINKYYTAREFPTIVDFTAPQRFKDKSHKLKKFFKLQVKDHLSLTQGFVVEVNDMHGKPKEESTYAQNGSLVSSTLYEYKVDVQDAITKHLNNTVRVAASDGSINTQKLIGVDMEVWQDFREETAFTEGTGFSPNTDGFWGFFIPILLFTGKSLLNKEDVRFRSAVMTKFIKRSGLLSKITKVIDGSTITTENLIWDAETGGVLATKTQNEFEDPIYHFTYPAHWVQEGMGMAYKTANTHLKNIYFLDGIPYLSPNGVNPLPNVNQMFSDGDEFGARRAPSKWPFSGDELRLTAYDVTDPNYQVRFYTDRGAKFSSGTNGTKRYDLFMIRPGKRNMAGMPVGSIVSKTNPLNYSTISAFALDAANNMVVEATGNVFYDVWQKDCDCQPGIAGDTINPYRHGMKGNWRLWTTYVNHQDRSASKMLTSMGVTNIRKDGVIRNFMPFWLYEDDQWRYYYNVNWANSWIRQSTTKIYDFKGNANEEQDALGNYSAAYYGYQGNLNTAVAHNTRLRQGMYDGFEDYTFDLMPGCDSLANCNFTSHGRFDVKISGTSSNAVSDSIAHTGKHSFRLGPLGTQALTLTLDTSANTFILDQINTRSNYGAGPNACHPSFKPSPGFYLLSAWVYTGDNCNSTSEAPSISVYQQNGGALQTQVGVPSGPVIDGWQRIYKKIEINTATGAMEVRLVNSFNKPIYFDDVRIHPWLGNMKSFAYDPVSLRLMATLDENNYATFYEYDDEGMLIRTKKETERGIMTVEEHRSVLKY